MKVVITANGQGQRMKGLSPLPKHHLYYKDKKIIDHLLEVFPEAEVLEGFESGSRRETLERVRDYEDCLIVDCDIIPTRDPIKIYDFPKDTVWCFDSTKDKYSSIKTMEGKSGFGAEIGEASENVKISNHCCSGMYYVESVAALLERMSDDNSIVSGMIGAICRDENNIIKLGDPEDYYEALGIHNDCFTDNRFLLNKNTVVKFCKTGKAEKSWYDSVNFFNTPKVPYADEEIIVMERIFPTTKPTADDFIRTVKILKNTEYAANGQPFKTYLDNLPPYEKPLYLPVHKGSFFHGDLSTHNILKNSRVWLIDPNYKDIFGSWLTDAGKAAFSFIAYEKDFESAKLIADAFGPSVWNYAVAEGLRVTKYKPEYLSIVNNVYEIYLQYGCKQSITKEQK
jgi:hypothetical protein